jgi:hypothetical protein
MDWGAHAPRVQMPVRLGLPAPRRKTLRTFDTRNDIFRTLSVHGRSTQFLFPRIKDIRSRLKSEISFYKVYAMATKSDNTSCTLHA